MNFDWQNAVVLAFVAAAAIYLARMAWRTMTRRKASCGGCHSCPTASESSALQVIGVDRLVETAPLPADRKGEPAKV